MKLVFRRMFGSWIAVVWLCSLSGKRKFTKFEVSPHVVCSGGTGYWVLISLCILDAWPGGMGHVSTYMCLVFEGEDLSC